MILETLMSTSLSGSEPWNSGGYSIEPTPMIAPWPCISRGTEWLVPMVPGLVSVMVVPAKSSTRQLAGAGLLHHLLVRGPELGEVQRLAALDARHQQLTGAVGPWAGRWPGRG